MFRISQVPTRWGTIVNIDGRLTKEYTQCAEEHCSELLRVGKRLCVILRDVSVVDEAGKNFLRYLAAEGVPLQGNGVYTTHLLSQIREEVP
jgi:hypothetical protein